MPVKPRRPLNDDQLESDRDYVLNNLDACVKWLDSQKPLRIHPKSVPFGPLSVRYIRGEK